MREHLFCSKRKTGFLGVILCLKNMFSLYHALVDGKELKYLLTFKLSQDFLETFFSAIRARGAWNNNPNALQYQAVYKRLLLTHDIRDFETSNCLADSVEILSVSAKKQHQIDPVAMVEDEYVVTEWDHDYIQTLWDLSPHVGNVVSYIGGFVVRRILKRQICAICSDHLTSPEISLLIAFKKRGKLINPSTEVIRICTVAEKVLRENISALFTTSSVVDVLINKIIKRLGVTFNTESMHQHILSQSVLDNHVMQVVKLILKYITVRLHQEGRSRSEKDSNIRHKYTKLILFRNQ
jgi:hypothetical protein